MALLALDNVTKRYRHGRTEIVALERVALELDAGEMVGIVGGPRAGKSTLLRLATGFETPDGGRVLFAGHDLARMSRREHEELLRHHVGSVWTVPITPPATEVLEHVAMPLIGAGRRYADAIACAREVLREVEADACVDTLLFELSPTDHTRVSLAQALIREPRLLLADEPAEGLDLIEREELLDLFRTLADERGVAVLLTGTDVTRVGGATRIATLGDGCLFEAGRVPPAVTALPTPRRMHPTL